MLDTEASEPNGDRPLSLLSVVVAVRDSADALGALHQRLRGGLEGVPYELLVVDDGSTDATAGLLDDLAGHDPRVRVLRLSRSFGLEIALTAGLDHAQGDAVVMLDPDLRDPPEAIHLLLQEWQAGAEVVYAVREPGEGEGSRSGAMAGWFARPLERLAGIELEPGAGELRLLDRRAVRALLSLRERSRFLRGMTVWVGFVQTAVTYQGAAADGAKGGRGVRGPLRRALEAATSFSVAPLQAVMAAGFALGALALLAVPVALVAWILGGFHSGALIVLVLLILGGALLLAVVTVGQYVSRIYAEVKRRPLYVVRARRNLPAAEPARALEREPAQTL